MHVHNKKISQSLQTLAWKMYAYGLVIAEAQLREFWNVKTAAVLLVSIN